ncbi:hypothetical protein M9H77_35267 [Catharanthus roseus]|uniref:Uncharacterized protein n=1 Tax=Catharanthus roseus TaxID=4058 RepID=A0ACB9ZSS3_CATRO|nr:hypothetical protein M9H77_35267 [Catharanthus roseus]
MLQEMLQRILSDLGEKKVTKKIKVDIRKSRDVEAKNKLLHKPSKSKQLIPAFASSVDHQNYIDRDYVLSGCFFDVVKHISCCGRVYDQLGEEEKKNEETVRNTGSNMISNTVTAERVTDRVLFCFGFDALGVNANRNRNDGGQRPRDQLARGRVANVPVAANV